VLLGVDVGGTFTDAVCIARDGAVHSAKVPSTPREEARGVLGAIEQVLARAGGEPEELERFSHGTTVATNALLEGRTARTAFVASEGFTDLIELGRQARPELYRLCRAGPAPLTPPQRRFGARERMSPQGPLRALEEHAARALVARVAAAEPQAVAVALLHSYAHPAHERLLGALLAEHLPQVHLSLSHELVGTFREYERAASTELDAALSPALAGYLRELRTAAAARGLVEPQVMQSSGGLISAGEAARHAALTVLSGPAGGVGGALLVSELAGERDVLCFDMGGTSCDVCLIDSGRVTETAARSVAGRPLALPALDIHTVGAGGGSVAWRDAGGALRVGPRSAGAQPGPACYGRGGEQPTVTDANLLLGRLPLDAPLAGGLRLDLRAAEAAVGRLAAALELDLLRCAEGIVRVAEAEMVRALRVMSVERGIDPRGCALMPFGGAGPLHAAALARELGMRTILCPRASGVLSALGLAAAAPRRDVARTVMLAGAALEPAQLERERRALIEHALGELGEAGGEAARVRVRHELRYRGQSFELPVEEEVDPAHGRAARGGLASGGLTPNQLTRAFAEAHEARYGFGGERAGVELVTMRVSAWGQAGTMRLRGHTAGSPSRGAQEVILDGERRRAALWRGELQAGTTVRGPALCAFPESTLLVAPGWTGEVNAQGTVRLEAVG